MSPPTTEHDHRQGDLGGERLPDAWRQTWLDGLDALQQTLQNAFDAQARWAHMWAQGTHPLSRNWCRWLVQSQSAAQSWGELQKSMLRGLRGVPPRVVAPILAADEPAAPEPAVSQRPTAQPPAAQAMVEPVATAPRRPQSSSAEPHDDLKQIDGIGPVAERKLNALGIHTFRQIAEWTDADIDRVEKSVVGARFSGRIRRDDWVGQARARAQQG